MAGTSFSLTEKLAVTGAFLALVVLAVGTEDDPGLVIAGQETVKDLRVVGAPPAPAPAPAAAPAPQAMQPQPVAEPALLSPATPTPSPGQSQALVTSATPSVQTSAQDADGQFSPELGRVPQDFSKGPPSG